MGSGDPAGGDPDAVDPRGQHSAGIGQRDLGRAAPGENGTPVDENQLVTYTVSFSENMDAATVSADDGLSNGIEAWFGTHPGQFSTGLALIAAEGTTTTFTHPLNPSPLSDVSGYYERSTDLSDWLASGEGPEGGPSVSFSSVTTDSTTIVTATSTTPMARIFLRVGATQDQD